MTVNTDTLDTLKLNALRKAARQRLAVAVDMALRYGVLSGDQYDEIAAIMASRQARTASMCLCLLTSRKAIAATGNRCGNAATHVVASTGRHVCGVHARQYARSGHSTTPLKAA